MFFTAAASIVPIYLIIDTDGKHRIPACRDRADKMQSTANVELAVGANSETIMSFLGRHKFSFSYDKFSKRYQGIDRNIRNSIGSDCAVVAYIYLDKNGNYFRSEFIATYTSI